MESKPEEQIKGQYKDVEAGMTNRIDEQAFRAIYKAWGMLWLPLRPIRNAHDEIVEGQDATLDDG